MAQPQKDSIWNSNKTFHSNAFQSVTHNPRVWRPFQKVFKIKTHLKKHRVVSVSSLMFMFALLVQQMPLYKPSCTSHHGVHHHALGVHQNLGPFQNVPSEAVKMISSVKIMRFQSVRNIMCLQGTGTQRLSQAENCSIPS